jgi:hypothetical protein
VAAVGLISSYFRQLIEPLPQGLQQLVHADVLPRHVGGDDLAIVHQQTGLTLN